jgi:hypothetical protein
LLAVLVELAGILYDGASCDGNNVSCGDDVHDVYGGGGDNVYGSGDDVYCNSDIFYDDGDVCSYYYLF